MIITVTLNPAVDRTVEISNFEINKVNRVANSRDDAAGKGINVSKVIKEMGYESIALGIIGGNAGNFIKEHLQEMKIKSDFLEIQKETRTNYKIIDKNNKTHTDINEKGPLVSKEEIDNIKTIIKKYSGEDNIFVLSGSVPKGVNSEIYKELIETVNSSSSKVILDADGELFLNGIEAAPYLVKPNIHELEEALDRKIENNQQVIEAAQTLMDKGISIVAVSLGKEGSMYISRDEVFLAKGFHVDVKSTVGAGDSMVAALAIALEKNHNAEDTIRLAAAVSTANVMTEGTQTGKKDDIEKLLKKIEIERL